MCRTRKYCRSIRKGAFLYVFPCVVWDALARLAMCDDGTVVTHMFFVLFDVSPCDFSVVELARFCSCACACACVCRLCEVGFLVGGKDVSQDGRSGQDIR